MWKPRRLTTLWAFTACYRDSFTLFLHTKVGFGGKEGKRALGRRRCRWEEDIKINLRERVRFGMNWIHLAQERNNRPLLTRE
jgi:hypothetical protein